MFDHLTKMQMIILKSKIKKGDIFCFSSESTRIHQNPPKFIRIRHFYLAHKKWTAKETPIAKLLGECSRDSYSKAIRRMCMKVVSNAGQKFPNGVFNETAPTPAHRL